jgi:hypothetical protein
LYNNGVLEAWLEGKTIQHKSTIGWTNISDESLFGTGLTLRIRPESIKQTLEWFKYTDDKPVLGSSVLFSYDGNFWTVNVTVVGYRTDDRNHEFHPSDYMHWAYITPPEDIPF